MRATHLKPALIYYVASSLDGYIARPDGRVDWLDSIDASTEDHGHQAFYAGIDGLLMGRGTYDAVQGLADDWPYADRPCMVLTRHPMQQAPTGVIARYASPAEGLSELEQLGCQRIWLVGGGALAGTCLAAGLLDELVVSLEPYLLGAGIPLFATALERRLKLHEQRSFSSGVVQLHYQLLPENPP